MDGAPAHAPRGADGRDCWHATGVTSLPDRAPDTPAPGEPDAPGPNAPTVTRAQPPRCPTRTRAYRHGQVVQEGFPAERISELLAEDEATTVWLDLRDPDADDLQILVQEFGLHPLAVEDAVQDHQRPKLDHYPTYRFLNTYAVTLDDGTSELSTSEISAFITGRALITVRKDDAFDVDTLVGRWDLAADLAVHGVPFLVHGLLDLVVDGHLRAVQHLDDALEQLEDQLFEPRPTLDVRRRGFELRKSIAGLRHVTVPMREVLDRYLRTEDRRTSAAMLPYVHDVQDHEQRAAESCEALREHALAIIDSHRNEQSYQLNEVTKKLAGWAAIIAVPTAVTGFYGQNVPYPGFSHHAGFVTSTLTIVVLAGGLFALLRRRGWL
ncbi:magnesium transporter [Kineococcus rhizosphaerae]|uniref:Magnesium transporter n=1 Tax=Kineococcus rhizosphaerae TaxID=559628 RepID=A0A2T0QXR9_9ACTN|nr:magnesium transporter [Kineococcus rhizosphaerae]